MCYLCYWQAKKKKKKKNYLKNILLLLYFINIYINMLLKFYEYFIISVNV